MTVEQIINNIYLVWTEFADDVLHNDLRDFKTTIWLVELSLTLVAGDALG